MNASNFKKIPFLFVSFSIFAVFGLPYSNSRTLAVAPDNTPSAFFFSKNLKLGDKGEDVIFLQQILNKNPDTVVSLDGDGSPGNETDFFGTLTKNAVIKFQELYASGILRPLGLIKGTGFVGITTRLKLNSLIGEGDARNQSFSSSSQPISQNANSENSNSSSAESSGEAVFSKSAYEQPGVRVYSTSEYQIKPGATLSIIGEGFAPTANIVHIGESRSIPNIKTDNSSSLSFTVPNDLPAGKYSIWVENENGTSANNTFKIFFVITNNPAQRPTLDRISPSVALYDGEITVFGSSFTSTGNNVYSSFGNVLNLPSSDGKRVIFKIYSFSEIYRLQKVISLVKGKNLKGWLYVENGNGISKDPTEFSIKI